MINLLFLCTGNSCRSIMAEAILNNFGSENFRAYSAGSFPTGEIHPLSLETLKSNNISISGYNSKSWDMFNDKKIDIVITVCDNANNETCPAFLGNSLKAHWGVPDPAKFKGSESNTKAEFNRIYKMLESRVNKLINLPLENLERQELQQELNAIGLQND